MKRLVLQFCLSALLCLIAAPVVYAQASRTWVSGVGDDANPCSRTAPCKTFAGAISKTATGGEIDVLDPGGYGAVTITKPITIDGGGGQVASVLVSGTNGIIVNNTSLTPGAVILRNLSINGVSGSGLNGVRFIAGSSLVVENCHIFGFSTNGIDVALPSGGDLVVHNTSFSAIGQSAVNLTTTAGTLSASLAELSIRGGTNGVVTGAAGATSVMAEVADSTITQTTGKGLWAMKGSISSEHNMLTSNAIAVQSDSGATVRLSDNGIYNNVTGIAGTGTVSTAGNNRRAGSTASGAPTTTITVL